MLEISGGICMGVGRVRHSKFDKEIFDKEMSADFEVC